MHRFGLDLWIIIVLSTLWAVQERWVLMFCRKRNVALWKSAKMTSAKPVITSAQRLGRRHPCLANSYWFESTDIAFVMADDVSCSRRHQCPRCVVGDVFRQWTSVQNVKFIINHWNLAYQLHINTRWQIVVIAGWNFRWHFEWPRMVNNNHKMSPMA